jgi:hypothetical protein
VWSDLSLATTRDDWRCVTKERVVRDLPYVLVAREGSGNNLIYDPPPLNEVGVPAPPTNEHGEPCPPTEEPWTTFGFEIAALNGRNIQVRDAVMTMYACSCKPASPLPLAVERPAAARMAGESLERRSGRGEAEQKDAGVMKGQQQQTHNKQHRGFSAPPSPSRATCLFLCILR